MHAHGKPYLEGLELALHLLREALAVFSELPLLGGLGSSILKPGFQLGKADLLLIKQNLPEGHCRTDLDRFLVQISLYQIHHELKAEGHFSWNGWLCPLAIKQACVLVK